MWLWHINVLMGYILLNILLVIHHHHHIMGRYLYLYVNNNICRAGLESFITNPPLPNLSFSARHSELLEFTYFKLFFENFIKYRKIKLPYCIIHFPGK